MVSISAGGIVLEPVVILKNLQNLRELTEYEPHCYFATSANGWMTKAIWIYYTHVFSAQISRYRLSLPEQLQDKDMLLTRDGHKGRISVLAAAIFIRHGIDVLVLPPHSSHLLWMFDVGPAAPPKTAVRGNSRSVSSRYRVHHRVTNFRRCGLLSPKVSSTHSTMAQHETTSSVRFERAAFSRSIR
jgi:hypothetical protein